MTELASTELVDYLRFSRSERRLAAMTCSAYERDVRRAWLTYLQGEGIEELAEVKVTHLRAFLAEEQKRRPAVSSQARTAAALKSFFRFLVEEERLVRDPALPPRTPKKREALPDVLTMGELERLLAYEQLRENALLSPERSFSGYSRSARPTDRSSRTRSLQPSSASTRHMWSSAPSPASFTAPRRSRTAWTSAPRSAAGISAVLGLPR